MDKKLTIDDVLNIEKEVQKMDTKKRHYKKRAKAKKKFLLLLDDDLFELLDKELEKLELSRSEFFKKLFLQYLNDEMNIKSKKDEILQILKKEKERIGEINYNFIIEKIKGV